MYNSTRGSLGSLISCSASEAILKGIAEDGGLYVPKEIPKLDKSLEELASLNYRELAFYILKKYLNDFSDDEIQKCVNSAYDEKFESELIAPLIEKNGVNFLELYHGPTLAFKDMALSILPYLLKTSAKKLSVKKEIVILTATSGDTGKAALEGFANVDGIKIIVFYPENGVSEIQKRQMITQEGKNTFVVGIDGNFDDAQNGVKEIFNSKEFNALLNENNYMLSSANSINIGRLVPQVVYYFYAYLNLFREKKISKNESINVVVPTGNFGNILAAYYAKNMGLPINKLICASNENNVLTDFVNEGVYNKKREFKVTNSPSMDILISSNLERLLYHISGSDSSLINKLMSDLSLNGVYEITTEMKEKLKEFYGGFASEEDTLKNIKDVYEHSKYVMDTHTAVAYAVCNEYKERYRDNKTCVIASTASPYKFTRSVCEAIDIEINCDDFHLVKKLSERTGLSIPKAIVDLDKKPILHNNFYKKSELKQAILSFLKV